MIGDPSFLLAESLYPIDYTPFTFKSRYRISAEDTRIIVEKYKKGCSLRDIANLLGCSKGKIRTQLRRSGHEPRDFSTRAARKAQLKRGKTNARPYFGFCYLEGEIVKDPREFPTLQLIHRYWCQGKSAHYIRIELDQAKSRSRLGKTWSWIAIQNILERLENKNIILSKGGKYELR